MFPHIMQEARTASPVLLTYRTDSIHMSVYVLLLKRGNTKNPSIEQCLNLSVKKYLCYVSLVKNVLAVYNADVWLRVEKSPGLDNFFEVTTPTYYGCFQVRHKDWIVFSSATKNWDVRLSGESYLRRDLPTFTKATNLRGFSHCSADQKMRNLLR